MTATSTSSPTTAPTIAPTLDFFSVEVSVSVDSPASAAGAAGSGVGLGLKPLVPLVAFGLGVVARGVVGVPDPSLGSGAPVCLDAPRVEGEEGVLSDGAGTVVAIVGGVVAAAVVVTVDMVVVVVVLVVEVVMVRVLVLIAVLSFVATLAVAGTPYASSSTILSEFEDGFFRITT
jgi:hypothetical protein